MKKQILFQFKNQRSEIDFISILESTTAAASLPAENAILTA